MLCSYDTSMRSHKALNSRISYQCGRSLLAHFWPRSVSGMLPARWFRQVEFLHSSGSQARVLIHAKHATMAIEPRTKVSSQLQPQQPALSPGRLPSS